MASDKPKGEDEPSQPTKLTKQLSQQHGQSQPNRHYENIPNPPTRKNLSGPQFSRPTSSNTSTTSNQVVNTTTESQKNDSLTNQSNNMMPEFPRIPTNQATLPLELQTMATKDVYPNQETSQTLKEKKEEMKKAKLEQKKAAESEKRIIWNRNAPENPFAHAHQYTREPGAW